MATFSVPIDVGSADSQQFRSLEALVDAGATYTMLPASLLASLGVEPDEERPFMLANGEQIRRQLAQTWVRIDGRARMTMVVFGDEGALPLLGAVTLEEFGLAVDPVARRLVPVPGLLV